SLQKWFELYQDTVLQRIIITTLDSNRDLLVTSARIEQDRLQSAIIKANIYPQLSYSASAGGGSAGTNAQKVVGGVDGAAFNLFGVLNWELDLWGKIRHNSRSAVARFTAEVNNRYALQT